jgi:hypothetical protein
MPKSTSPTRGQMTDAALYWFAFAGGFDPNHRAIIAFLFWRNRRHKR